MTTVTTLYAGVGLIRDLFILVVFTLGAGKVVDVISSVMGQQAIQSELFGFIQPQYWWFYVVVFLAAIMRFVYFFATTIQRVDYAEDFMGPY
jgi:hypothetical protein